MIEEIQEIGGIGETETGPGIEINVQEGEIETGEGLDRGLRIGKGRIVEEGGDLQAQAVDQIPGKKLVVFSSC